MVGACIGFVGIIGVRVLVLGDSFDGLHSKFAETGMLETVGVSLLAILILLFSIFLQVLLHEGGHLVCGLATGYRFVSFRIFNLTFIRKDGKLCIKRFSLAGTGGQCLLTPPERPLEDIPTTLYNLGGVLANLLTAILAFLPLLTVDEPDSTRYPVNGGTSTASAGRRQRSDTGSSLNSHPQLVRKLKFAIALTRMTQMTRIFIFLICIISVICV